VGGRIVADVFAALLRGDPTSYLNQGAPFTPIADFTRDGRTFGFAELINVALGRMARGASVLMVASSGGATKGARRHVFTRCALTSRKPLMVPAAAAPPSGAGEAR